MERRFLATRFDYDVVRGHMMTWGKAVDLATIAQHKEVEKVRALYLTDKTAYEDAKKQLPAFCVSSTYPSRKRGLKPMEKGRILPRQYLCNNAVVSCQLSVVSPNTAPRQLFALRYSGLIVHRSFTEARS